MGLGGSRHDFGKRGWSGHHWSGSEVRIQPDEPHMVAARKIGAARAGPAVGGERVARKEENGSDSKFLSVHVMRGLELGEG